MPSKNKKTKKPQNKTRTIVYAVIVALVILLFLVIYGIQEIKKSAEIKEQQSSLDQTLKDITGLYGSFVANTPEKDTLTQKPENVCNKESVKYVSYVCGTRAQLSYKGGEELLGRQLADLDSSIDSTAFTVLSRGEVREMSLRNGQSVQYILKDNSSNQECVINGSFLRDQQETHYSFTCNLTTKHQLYKLND